MLETYYDAMLNNLYNQRDIFHNYLTVAGILKFEHSRIGNILKYNTNWDVGGTVRRNSFTCDDDLAATSFANTAIITLESLKSNTKYYATESVPRIPQLGISIKNAIHLIYSNEKNQLGLIIELRCSSMDSVDRYFYSQTEYNSVFIIKEVSFF